MLPRVFTIEPNPHWVVIDNFSKLPNGAAIYTYRSLNKNQFKAAFQDAAGMIPYQQPIVGFDNGTFPPIYWEFDPNDPSETYYIRVYDKQNLPGSDAQFLWDFDGLSGGTSGGGGGGPVTAPTVIDNLIYNNVFFRNVGTTLGTPSLPQFLLLAPGSHEGFVNEPGNANITAGGPVGPDIIFAKNNTAASDSITFRNYPQVGTRYIPGGDISPQIIMDYACTNVAGSTETYKYIQFPISQGVQNLSGQDVIITINAVANSGNNQLFVRLRQFYGSGVAASNDDYSAPTIVTLGSDFTLWTSIDIPFTVPNATGKTIGFCQNDGLFLQIGLPLNALTNISLTKPEMFLGTVAPSIQYENNDSIDSVINTPRTGDIRTSINNFVPYGWVPMNDGTIANGNPAIVPPAGGALARNNIDTFPLFNLLWNTFAGNQTLAPMYNSAGLPTAYGGDPVADFVANNQIKLTVTIGRVFAGVSPSNALGTFTGAETHLITIPELPQHTHDNATGNTFLFTGPFGGGLVDVGNFGTQSLITGGVTNWGAMGGPKALSLMQPTTYMNVFIKL